MKIMRYEITVSEGALAHVHGCDFTICEVHVPSLGLFVNKECVFVLEKKDAKERLTVVRNIEKINVNEKTARLFKRLQKACVNQNNIGRELRKLFIEQVELEIKDRQKRVFLEKYGTFGTATKTTKRKR